MSHYLKHWFALEPTRMLFAGAVLLFFRGKTVCSFSYNCVPTISAAIGSITDECVRRNCNVAEYNWKHSFAAPAKLCFFFQIAALDMTVARSNQFHPLSICCRRGSGDLSKSFLPHLHSPSSHPSRDLMDHSRARTARSTIPVPHLHGSALVR